MVNSRTPNLLPKRRAGKNPGDTEKGGEQWNDDARGLCGNMVKQKKLTRLALPHGAFSFFGFAHRGRNDGVQSVDVDVSNAEPTKFRQLISRELRVDNLEIGNWRSRPRRWIKFPHHVRVSKNAFKTPLKSPESSISKFKVISKNIMPRPQYKSCPEGTKMWVSFPLSDQNGD